MEITTLLVGYVGVNDLAASVICANIFMIFYMITQSLSYVTGAMVGNSLGEGHKKKAMKHIRVGTGVAVIIMLAIVVSIVFSGDSLARAYTPNLEVQELISKVMLAVAAMLAFDSVVAMGKGIIRGMGLQKYSAVIFFVGYWGFSIPASAILVLVYEKGVIEVWIMIAIGAAITFFGVYGVIIFSNWDKIIIRVQNELSGNQ